MTATVLRRLPAAGLILALTTPAQAAPDLLEALKSGQPSVNLRLRVESVENDALQQDASALTLRSRLGYRTGKWQDFQLYGEFEGTAAFGGEAYNSSRNGKVDRPVIVDPEGEEFNQHYLDWTGLANTRLRYGRQRLILDNARYIGNVGWRQNEQTFDGATLHTTALKGSTLQFGYLSNSNFIQYGNNRPMDSFFANAGIGLGKLGKLGLYAYQVEFRDAANDSRSLGAHLSGKPAIGEQTKLLYRLELARQSDIDDTAGYDANYLHLQAGFAHRAVSVTAGYEQLGSDDGNAAFQTPLATAHAFNGWADLFLRTPDAGLTDLYLDVTVKAWGFVGKAVYHDFAADESGPGDDYGSELDLLVKRGLAKGLTGLVKYAAYSADDFGADRNILWAQLDFKF